MKKDLTEIVVVIDKSGSMEPRQADVIGGFNKFLSEQKSLDGEALLTMTQFDTTYNLIHNGTPLKGVPELDSSTYSPGGMTALLDALGRTIDEVGNRLKDTKEEERPERVIVVVITDGEENSSKEYSKEQVKTRVEEQQSTYKWEFIFLGADIDAFSVAGGIGIAAASTTRYSNTSVGTQSVYAAASSATSSFRKTGKTGSKWKDNVK